MTGIATLLLLSQLKSSTIDFGRLDRLLPSKSVAFFAEIGTPEASSSYRYGQMVSTFRFSRKETSAALVKTLESAFDRLFPGRKSEARNSFSSVEMEGAIGFLQSQNSASIFSNVEEQEPEKYVKELWVRLFYQPIPKDKSKFVDQSKIQSLLNARQTWRDVKTKLGFVGDCYVSNYVFSTQSSIEQLPSGTVLVKTFPNFYMIGKTANGNRVIVQLEDIDGNNEMARTVTEDKVSASTGLKRRETSLIVNKSFNSFDDLVVTNVKIKCHEDRWTFGPTRTDAFYKWKDAKLCTDPSVEALSKFPSFRFEQNL